MAVASIGNRARVMAGAIVASVTLAYYYMWYALAGMMSLTASDKALNTVYIWVVALATCVGLYLRWVRTIQRVSYPEPERDERGNRIKNNNYVPAIAPPVRKTPKRRSYYRMVKRRLTGHQRVIHGKARRV